MTDPKGAEDANNELSGKHTQTQISYKESLLALELEHFDNYILPPTKYHVPNNSVCPQCLPSICCLFSPQISNICTCYFQEKYNFQPWSQFLTHSYQPDLYWHPFLPFPLLSKYLVFLCLSKALLAAAPHLSSPSQPSSGSVVYTLCLRFFIFLSPSSIWWLYL